MNKNKQDLIEKIRELDTYGSSLIERNEVLELIRQLDELQKVVVPQFVADWYEEHKDNLEYNIWDWMKYNLGPKKRENVIFSQWLGKTVNNPVETLIKMKLYGYEVEKEKRYIVKLKNGQPLVKALLGGKFYFNQNITAGNYKATRKELEEAGFGWVFDCEGIEVEEVTE